MHSDFILIPYGNAFLQLTPAEFAAAMGRGLAPGANSAPATPPLGGEGLVDSADLGKRLGMTAEWCEAAAREGTIPSLRLGKYLRFDPAAVLLEIAENGPAAKVAAGHR